LPLPSFDMRGLLPPFVGSDAVTVDRSPYWTTMPELVAAMGTTRHRRQLLRNLITYRGLLAGEGYIGGIQFIDGSFVENVEINSNRPPSDIDVFSVLNVPPKYITDMAAWQTAGLPFWQREVIDRSLNKLRFSLDTHAAALILSILARRSFGAERLDVASEAILSTTLGKSTWEQSVSPSPLGPTTAYISLQSVDWKTPP
jgi:hypothetical protein